MNIKQTMQAITIGDLCAEVHEANKKWWADLSQPLHHITSFDNTISADGVAYRKLDRNVGELLCLVHSEISEALEGHRKDLMDDKLPHRKMFEVELADAIIRIFDIAAGLNLDLGGAYVEKMAYNASRADHSIAERLKSGGKKY